MPIEENRKVNYNVSIAETKRLSDWTEGTELACGHAGQHSVIPHCLLPLQDMMLALTRDPIPAWNPRKLKGVSLHSVQPHSKLDAELARTKGSCNRSEHVPWHSALFWTAIPQSDLAAGGSRPDDIRSLLFPWSSTGATFQGCQRMMLLGSRTLSPF